MLALHHDNAVIHEGVLVYGGGGFQFIFVNECSFLFCCSHRQCGQGLEHHLRQPDWEPHLYVLEGIFSSYMPYYLAKYPDFVALSLVLLLTGETGIQVRMGRLGCGVAGEVGWERHEVADLWELEIRV